MRGRKKKEEEKEVGQQDEVSASERKRARK